MVHRSASAGAVHSKARCMLVRMVLALAMMGRALVPETSFAQVSAPEPAVGPRALASVDLRPRGSTLHQQDIGYNDTAMPMDANRVTALESEPTLTPPAPETFVSGHCYLQGRTQHQGVIVTNGRGDQVETSADGSFSIPSGPILTLEFTGYLSAQADLRELMAQNPPGDDQNAIDLGAITLSAGDMNNDGFIDVFDLTYMANQYQMSDGAGDLNDDGVVDILDLVLISNNFGLQGPVTNWQDMAG